MQPKFEETKNFFKRDNSVNKINHTKTKSELDLRNSMMYPHNNNNNNSLLCQFWAHKGHTKCTYIKFEFNVCNHSRDNEQKLKISVF
jgi:hypothetical protein